MQLGEYIQQIVAASLKCLGTGNGYPSGHRAHSCYLYEFGKTSVMVDCGEPATATFKRLKIDWNIPDAIFISHLHFDHCGGLFMLLQGMYLEHRTKPLKIYMPRDGIDLFQNLLKAAGFVPEVVNFELGFEEISNLTTVSVNDIQITPVLNSHLDSFKQKVSGKYDFKYESFSFLITAGGKKIFHTSDIGSIEDLKPVSEYGVDTLVCELYHVKPEQLFEYLQNAKLEKLILVHLDRRYRKNIEEIKSLAGKFLPETVCVIPDDGAQIFLETKQPSV